MTPWEKYLERRTKNIGFYTRLGAFKDPTPAEKESALQIEIASWQKSKGTKPYSLSAEYTTPRGHGVNLLMTDMNIEGAIKAYVETPMVIVGRHANIGIDVSVYSKSQSVFKKALSWIKDKIKQKPQTSKKLSFAEMQLYQKLLESENGKD